MQDLKPSAISILIVEDIPEMRNLLENVVREIPGVRVSGLAKNTFEARFEVSRRRPDLVFLDEILPGESAHDLLQELLGMGIAVVLITGLQEEKTRELHGALARILKPAWDSVAIDRVRFEKVIFNHFKRSDA